MTEMNGESSTRNGGNGLTQWLFSQNTIIQSGHYGIPKVQRREMMRYSIQDRHLSDADLLQVTGQKKQEKKKIYVQIELDGRKHRKDSMIRAEPL